MHQMKKDPIHKKVMETLKNLMDIEDYDYKEALDYAVSQRRFLIKRALPLINCAVTLNPLPAESSDDENDETEDEPLPAESSDDENDETEDKSPGKIEVFSRH